MKHHHTWANHEHKIGSYAGSQHWQSKVSSASGHSSTGEGARALTQHLEGKTKRYPELKVGEQYTLPSTPLQEFLSDHSNIARYAEFLNKSKDPANSPVFDGGAYQSTNSAITAMSDFRETAALQARAAKKFANGADVTEQNAVRSRQAKANPRPNGPVEFLTNSSESDKDFLSALNKSGLLQEGK